jgi:hypothetical protein
VWSISPTFAEGSEKGSGKANHGLVVSETAKSKESDPGKGEAISTQAKTQRQALQDRDNQNNSEKNHLTNQIPKVHFGYLHHAKVFLI